MTVTIAGPAVPWRWEHHQLHGPYLTVQVRGRPAPQGSKSYKGQTKAGKPILAESSEALKPWRSQVQQALEDEMRRCEQRFGLDSDLCPWPIVGPVAVHCAFTMPKPKAAPKRRRTFPVTQPDVDKLARAVLDAGTAAGVWRDDAQVIDLAARKVYPDEAPQSLPVPGLYVSVFTVAGAGL